MELFENNLLLAVNGNFVESNFERLLCKNRKVDAIYKLC